MQNFSSGIWPRLGHFFCEIFPKLKMGRNHSVGRHNVKISVFVCICLCMYLSAVCNCCHFKSARRGTAKVVHVYTAVAASLTPQVQIPPFCAAIGQKDRTDPLLIQQEL